MFQTGLRQFRMAWSTALGKPFQVRNLELLIADAQATLAEFGTPGDDLATFLNGSFSDPRARHEMQSYSLQRTVRHLLRHSPFYQQRLAPLALKVSDLTAEDLQRIPLTLKADLRTHGRAFLSNNTHPSLMTRTTGTTGQPLEMWLSRYEIEHWSSLIALGYLLRGQILPSDHIQFNMSSRANLAIQLNLLTYRLIGARTSLLGLIRPEESLDALLSGGDDAPTILNTYPSYLAQLLQLARQRDLQPRDFHLRSILCGSEPLSVALKQEAQTTFGAPITDIYSMTEIAPVASLVCSQGHLHYDVTMGFTEVLSFSTGQPAAPGELGTLVVTPYYPYRECMPVLRYDTRDLVRCLPDEPLTCEAAAIPATSNTLGKADSLLFVQDRPVPLRLLVEILEALPSNPWPARFRAHIVNDTIELELPASTLAGLSEEEVVRRFAAEQIPVRLRVTSLSATELPQMRPLRADLREFTFTTPSNPQAEQVQQEKIFTHSSI